MTTTRKRNLYLTTLAYIKEHGKLPLKLCSRQKLNYYVSRLKQEGKIRRLGYGVWQIIPETEQVKNAPESSKVGEPKVAEIQPISPPQKKEIRGHGFVFKIHMSHIPRWDKISNFLINKKIPFRIVKNGKGNFPAIDIMNHILWLGKENIVIYSPKDASYFNITAEAAYADALYKISTVFKRLETIMGVILMDKGKIKIECVRGHFAKVEDDLAKHCNAENIKWEIKGKDGKIWWLIDKSFNLNESETIHAKTARGDMDEIVVPFANSLKDYKENTGDAFRVTDVPPAMYALVKTLETQGDMIKLLVDTQALSAKHIKHILDMVLPIAEETAQKDKKEKEPKQERADYIN